VSVEAISWALNLAPVPADRGGQPSSACKFLVVLLSGYADGATIRYSDIYPAMRARDLSIERTAEVLQHLGIFRDDRHRAFEGWLAAKLADPAPGIARETEAWARALHDGGPRSPARNQETARRYVNLARPALAQWSGQYQHLREITSDDIRAFLAGLHGTQRNHATVAVRSLFGYARRHGVIFRNPAARLRGVSRQPTTIIQPLDPARLRPVLAAASHPAARLILALAAVHAARTGAIRDLQLDDLDLGNRRISIGGRSRPLDDLTHALLNAWLSYRQARWPQTANAHVLVNQQTAMETGPVSGGWISEALPANTVTVEQLRIDRHLDEALTRGPDPLHLSAVFGVSPKTAMRYANAARHLLATQAEEPASQDGGGPRTGLATRC
jgi:integrase